MAKTAEWKPATDNMGLTRRLDHNLFRELTANYDSYVVPSPMNLTTVPARRMHGGIGKDWSGVRTVPHEGAFHQQAEWRMMNQTLSPADSPLDIDDINLWLPSGDAAISEVVVGPTTPPDQVALIRALLDREGLHHVVVRKSELALRN